jgi:Nuclear pore complex scaffold, nucleoporins 186/192/205
VASARSEQIKALYTYESKMALLTRLASSTTGAELLLETGLMLRLAEMGVFSSRPESMTGDDGPMARCPKLKKIYFVVDGGTIHWLFFSVFVA